MTFNVESSSLINGFLPKSFTYLFFTHVKVLYELENYKEFNSKIKLNRRFNEDFKLNNKFKLENDTKTLSCLKSKL
jgi:hypothetical protein